MEKTLILGNNTNKKWIAELGFPTTTVPNISTGRSGDIVKFIKDLPTDLDCVIIDVDSINSENPELPLDIALYIRLMLNDCLKTSLSKIIFVTDLPIEAFMDFGVKSVVLMTKGVLLISSEYVREGFETMNALSPSEYVDGFLNLIKIEPQEKVEGRHSIANEWGANILAKVVTNGKISIGNANLHNSLYFLYSTLASLDADEVQKIIDGKICDDYHNNTPISESFNYLLIDDEANKGWRKVLELMFPNASGMVFDGRIEEYDQLPQNMRHNIQHNKFDLIFLDLRMNGVAEESISVPDDFSGMRILKSIKSINPGIQVIMLTATNKSWNLKALLDAGADGYYMKESPEYHFPLAYSEQNYDILKNEIKNSLLKGFLKDVYSQICKIDLPLGFSNLERLIKNQMLLSFDLVKKANTPSERAFAYIALEQVLERIAAALFKEDGANDEWRCYLKDCEENEHEYRIRDIRKYFYLKDVKPNSPLWLKIASIYYLLFGGAYEDFYKDLQSDIKLRNDYIHENIKPIITWDDYQNLFDTVMELISVFK